MSSPHRPPDRDLLATKRDVRERLLSNRQGRAESELDRNAAAAAASLLGLDELGSARTAACYLAIGSEPRTGPILDGLRAAGVEVLLPVLLPDNDLDWAPYDGPEELTPGRFGLLEPSTPRRGPSAIAGVDVVVVPALAIGPRGQRLGRGGGSYDRALARIASTAVVIALVHPGETDLDFPTEAHDRPVDAVVAGTDLIRF